MAPRFHCSLYYEFFAVYADQRSIAHWHTLSRLETESRNIRTRIREPRALSSVLAALQTLQTRALGSGRESKLTARDAAIMLAGLSSKLLQARVATIFLYYADPRIYISQNTRARD